VKHFTYNIHTWRWSLWDRNMSCNCGRRKWNRSRWTRNRTQSCPEEYVCLLISRECTSIEVYIIHLLLYTCVKLGLSLWRNHIVEWRLFGPKQRRSKRGLDKITRGIASPLFSKSKSILMRSPCCLCACMCNRSIISSNGSVNTFPRQWLYTQQ
jgi:hypothetical protein